MIDTWHAASDCAAARETNRRRDALRRTHLLGYQHWVLERQLRVSLPSGVVQVDHVPIGHPDCPQTHVAGPAQTKLNPAWPASAGQSNLSHRESVVLRATRNRPWSRVIRVVGRPDRYRPIRCTGWPIGMAPVRPLRLDGRAEPVQREFLRFGWRVRPVTQSEYSDCGAFATRRAKKEPPCDHTQSGRLKRELTVTEYRR